MDYLKNTWVEYRVARGMEGGITLWVRTYLNSSEFNFNQKEDTQVPQAVWVAAVKACVEEKSENKSHKWTIKLEINIFNSPQGN